MHFRLTALSRLPLEVQMRRSESGLGAANLARESIRMENLKNAKAGKAGQG
jgi:hypothetical protein